MLVLFRAQGAVVSRVIVVDSCISGELFFTGQSTCEVVELYFFFSSRRRHTRCDRDWSSDVCSSDLRLSASLAAAAATYENAKLTREVAEIAVIEYKEGIYRQDTDTIKGEIALAESE